MMAKYTITIEEIEPSGHCLGGIKLETNITQAEFDVPFSGKSTALLIAAQTYQFARLLMKSEVEIRLQELNEGAE